MTNKNIELASQKGILNPVAQIRFLRITLSSKNAFTFISWIIEKLKVLRSK